MHTFSFGNVRFFCRPKPFLHNIYIYIGGRTGWVSFSTSQPEVQLTLDIHCPVNPRCSLPWTYIVQSTPGVAYLGHTLSSQPHVQLTLGIHCPVNPRCSLPWAYIVQSTRGVAYLGHTLCSQPQVQLILDIHCPVNPMGNFNLDIHCPVNPRCSLPWTYIVQSTPGVAYLGHTLSYIPDGETLYQPF